MSHHFFNGCRSCCAWYPLNGAISFIVDRSKSKTKLHSELLECASTSGQVDYSAFPSLKDSWIDPRSKKLPYGKEIGVVIAAVISYCNKDVLKNDLIELCKEMAIILKQQRGNILFLAHFYWSVFIFG